MSDKTCVLILGGGFGGLFSESCKGELISPDNWNMDFYYLNRPNARRVQLDLL